MKSLLFSWVWFLTPLLFALTFGADTDPFDFYLSTERIFGPEEPEIYVSLGGQIGADPTTFRFKAYRLDDPVGFFRTQENPHSLDLGYDADTTTRKPILSDKDKLVASWEERVRSRDRYWYNHQVKVPLKQSGVYLIVAEGREKEAATVLIISELGMVVKQAKGEALAFVVDRRSGERVADFPLSFVRRATTIAETRTGGDGVAQTTIPPFVPSDDDMERGWGYGNSLIVLGESHGKFVISDSYFYGYQSTDYRVYLHTDRPVYRPSQTVYYRGIARQVADDGTYRNATGDTVAVEVTDARGNSIAKDTLTLSDFGTFSGELALADEPPLGEYQIHTRIGDHDDWFSFSVEEYKKPEYEVTVTTDRAQYTRGDRITAHVKADYYFGSPVSEGTVEYSVIRSRYWRPWWYGSEWAYLYRSDMRFSGYGAETVNTGSGKLASDGTFTIEYETDGKTDEDYLYTIQANVVDASRRSIAGSATVQVTRGEFYVTAWTDKYLYQPGSPATIFVRAASFDGDKPVTTSFNVRVERTWWERNDRKSRRETVWSGSGTTDSHGEGSVTFTPQKTGYFNVIVEATDSRGATITASAYVYVADRNYAYWDSDNRNVQIIPDKALYKPGEMMTALIVMPEQGGDLLVTTEGAAIYGHQVERLDSRSALVRIRIEDRYAPVFYLAASAIQHGEFVSNLQQISVAPEGKRLRVEVRADQDTYKPGDSGLVTVRVLNEQGEPAPETDVAVSIVDEALYAIRPDMTPDIGEIFYGMRGNEVSTQTSLYFRFYTRSRDKGLSEAFGDNAVAPTSAEIVDDAAMRSVAKSAAGFALGAEEQLVQPVLRSDFKDLMFWTPSVRTDRNGRATLHVKFPDNLTTWRITARGVTQATAVGQATAEVIARKDLLVRMETPRFITAGDKLLIATTVHNYLSEAKSTRVEFKAEGVRATKDRTTVTIPAGGEQRIDWEITAPKAGNATLTVRALTNEESDAMELTVPVLPQGLRTASGAIAEIDETGGTETLTLTIPENADPSTSEMYISISPSPASSVIGALDALIGYPYGCVEQTMSRFLPTVVVADALKGLDVPFDPKKREELPKMVAKGLTRLYGLQHPDGGWGWWEHDETNPFMTAYVMYGMTIAGGAGYDVDGGSYARGTNSLRDQIEKGTSDEPTTRAYMLYVAGMIDSIDVAGPIRKLADRGDLNPYAQALLALAAQKEGMEPLAKRLVDALESEAKVTATGAYWQGSTWHYRWQEDQVETSAFVVKALLAIRGETDLTRKGVRWLLAQKEGDAWHNTRQTAMVVYAIIDHLKASHELSPDYTATASVNGREVFVGHISRNDVFSGAKEIRVDAKSLRQGANTITVSKSGSGRLYATARVIYYATGPAVKPTSAGFTVEREYFTLDRKTRKGGVVYTKAPFRGTVKSGDEILVRVTVEPDSRYEYFMLEDPLPAGCEVVTDAQGYTIEGEEGYGNQGPIRKGGYRVMPIWNWWYADRDVRDEKVAFFAPRIESREYTFTYILRAQIPGSYSVMPSVAALMYYPEVRGNSGTIAMTITD